MEHNDTQSRETPSFTAQQNVLPGQAPYSEQSPAIERYRQPAFAYEQSAFPSASTSRPSVLPGGVQVQSYPYTYSQGGPLLGSNLQPEPAQQAISYSGESERSQQEFQPYGHGMLFSVPAHTSSQATPPTRYNPPQQYQQRSNPALDVLSTSFNIPQQYYVGHSARLSRGSDISPGSATGQAISHDPEVRYSHPGHGPRGSISASAYPNVMDSESQPGPHSTFSDAQYSHSVQTSQAAPDYDNTYDAYQTELKRVYTLVRDGQLGEASHNLLVVSRWLLGNVEALGLVRDDESLHSQRLALWEEFNNCWLTLLQSQKERLIAILRAGQNLQPEESTISQDSLEEMGQELVSLCDGMERYGLVDYQLGVWEEQIIAVLTQCLDLLEAVGEQPGASSSLR